MKKILQYLFEYKTLAREQAKEIIINIGKGVYNETEIASFITVFLMRSITIEELQGFRDGLLELCVPVDLNGHKTMDIVGTGGDGKNTFNISTLACFIVAGAGQKVAKHGNYGASSVSGASNVMEQLGYKFKNDNAQLKKEVEEANICFLHAPLFHPAFALFSICLAQWLTLPHRAINWLECITWKWPASTIIFCNKAENRLPSFMDWMVMMKSL
jgi:anthranilate phosphoribosyltransferase